MCFVGLHAGFESNMIYATNLPKTAIERMNWLAMKNDYRSDSKVLK